MVTTGASTHGTKLGYHTIIMRRENRVPAQKKTRDKNTRNSIAPRSQSVIENEKLLQHMFFTSLELAVSAAADHASGPEAHETPPTDLPPSPEAF